MTGGAGDDTMTGGSGDDFMQGDGNSLIYSSAGEVSYDDIMDGGAGNDTLDGVFGDDILNGGSGDDILTGGEGGDTFVFTAEDGEDTITDFNAEEDTLNFAGAAYDDIRVTTANGNTTIAYGNTAITLEGIEMDKDQIWSRVDTDAIQVHSDSSSRRGGTR